jgi:hypothetical protein
MLEGHLSSDLEINADRRRLWLRLDCDVSLAHSKSMVSYYSVVHTCQVQPCYLFYITGDRSTHNLESSS